MVKTPGNKNNLIRNSNSSVVAQWEFHSRFCMEGVSGVSPYYSTACFPSAGPSVEMFVNVKCSEIEKLIKLVCLKH